MERKLTNSESLYIICSGFVGAGVALITVGLLPPARNPAYLGVIWLVFGGVSWLLREKLKTHEEQESITTLYQCH